MGATNVNLNFEKYGTESPDAAIAGEQPMAVFPSPTLEKVVAWAIRMNPSPRAWRCALGGSDNGVQPLLTVFLSREVTIWYFPLQYTIREVALLVF